MKRIAMLALCMILTLCSLTACAKEPKLGQSDNEILTYTPVDPEKPHCS